MATCQLNSIHIIYRPVARILKGGGVHFRCQLTEGCAPNFFSWGAASAPAGTGAEPRRQTHFGNNIENWHKIRSLASKKWGEGISYGVPTKLKSGRGTHLWFPLCRGEAGLLVTPMYGYVCVSFPLVPVVGLFSRFFFLLCLSQVSLHTILPS